MRVYLLTASYLRYSLLAFLVVFFAGSALGQRSTSKRGAVKEYRASLSAGAGILPTFLSGGQQEAPSITATAEYRITDRLGLGVNFGQASTTSRPYIDRSGVATFSTTNIQHYGLRLSGVMVKSGRFGLYGGLQLGINVTDQELRHEFPSDFAVESQTAYLANRPTPFGDPANQLAAIGFLGGTARLLPRLGAYLEVGNNLSLANAGLRLEL